jgi:prepilin-type N-terminal cleavage/methylation domain-containing protein/prepilin-type processing-associated H-X9-DG protein
MNRQPRRRVSGQDGGPTLSHGSGGGFTLIELLVVLAIISILAALLLPALNRSKQLAYSTYCRSNLRQYGQALRAYVNDFQFYPPWQYNAVTGFQMSTTPGNNVWWYQMMEPYTLTKWINQVSTASGPAPPPASIQSCPGYSMLGGVYFDSLGAYGYNGLLGTRVTNTAQGPFQFSARLRDSDIAHPAEMPAFGDTHINFPGGSFPSYISPFCGIVSITPVGFDTDYILGLPEAGGASGAACAALAIKRHAGQWNINFCDGHTEAVKLGYWFSSTNIIVMRRWDPFFP